MLKGFHVARGWGGDPPWFMDCCPHEPCGLTDPEKWTPGCPNHNMTKTIRGMHAAEECPGAEIISQ